MTIKRDTIASVEELDPFEDEYVYDIGINHENPWFFANDILLHNSAYFSAYPIMRDQPEFADFEWTPENVVSLYDQIADITNDSFPAFMNSAFNVPPEQSVIKAGRELCASKGLFITKKRYAVMIFDKEGKRKDLNGKPGEIKAMGLDLRRSDTKPEVQTFLYEILTDVLTDIPREEIFKKIQKFRNEFRSWPNWAKGSPKRVNNLTKYGNIKRMQDSFSDALENSKGNDKKKTIPGHVAAALAWNILKEINRDTSSMSITDGSKTIVCKLKSNNMGMTSVAYPIDQLILPDWFKSLPFDSDAMEQAALDSKLDNLLSVLKWDLSDTHISDTYNLLFS